MPKKKCTFIDLFAGLGGFHIALGDLGHECVFASELRGDLRKLYAINFPGTHIEGDITKTTPTDSLSFTIKHNQLFVNSEKNYLVAMTLEENNSGRTLEELITSLLNNPDICNDLRFNVNIEKEKRRVAPSEINSRRFILKKINAYCANAINPFVKVPDCVEDLSYKLNLLPFTIISLSDILP